MTSDMTTLQAICVKLTLETAWSLFNYVHNSTQYNLNSVEVVHYTDWNDYKIALGVFKDILVVRAISDKGN